MNSTTRRIALPAAGIALVSGALLAGAMVPAQAATPAAAAPNSVSTAVTVQGKRLARPNRVVGAGQIKKYRITQQQMNQIMRAHQFAQTSKARKIRQRESHGNYRIVSRSGYSGAYQFDARTWRAMGGARFAPTANRAPAWAQDYIMWRTVQSHGWAPWGG